MKDDPSVSVAMGIRYRRESLEPLHRSVESILNQTVADFELLICDDGSTLEASRVLDEYAARDGRIRLLRPGGALELPQKLNVCLRQARGGYIARMDDDDWSHPERFARQLAALEQEREIAFAGCSVNLCRDGARVGARDLPVYPSVRDFYDTSPFVHPALVFRRSALEAVGGYCEEPYCRLCEDYDLLMRLYAAGYRGKNLPDRLLDYTLPPKGKKNRALRDRLHEAQTRWRRYHELGVLHEAWIYTAKPIAAALLPQRAVERLREIRDQHTK
ncbi:MAG: glycosyltransferase [Oscillospiraceae bacterium]|nr:glycosyltransferase [Oscillospiraceae bacterium]